MKILIDMNLSPEWVQEFKSYIDFLENGALIILDENKKRVRILPL